MARMAILSGLGYVFMGIGALMAMIGIFATMAKERLDNVFFVTGVATLLLGAGFSFLSHGIGILWPA